MNCDNCEKEVPENWMHKFKKLYDVRDVKATVTHAGDSHASYKYTEYTPKYCINCLREAMNELTGKVCQ